MGWLQTSVLLISASSIARLQVRATGAWPRWWFVGFFFFLIAAFFFSDLLIIQK
jgi:membrane protein YdbS with pleckstrin-like domain